MTYFVARCYDCMQKTWLDNLTQLTFCFVQRWVTAYQRGIFLTIVHTTNGLERQHQKLKYSFLSDTSNGSLSELVSTIVKEFVPICHRRYASILSIKFCKNELEKVFNERKLMRDRQQRRRLSKMLDAWSLFSVKCTEKYVQCVRFLLLFNALFNKPALLKALCGVHIHVLLKWVRSQTPKPDRNQCIQLVQYAAHWLCLGRTREWVSEQFLNGTSAHDYDYCNTLYSEETNNWTHTNERTFLSFT